MQRYVIQLYYHQITSIEEGSRMLKKIQIIFIYVLYSFLPSFSYALDLSIPVSCNYGKDCYISNYFDHDAKEGVMKDRACGSMTEDGYQHTDFILQNVAQMKKGVNVVAGDSGVVKYIRNDIADVNVSLSGTSAVRGHECGNGVLIEHKRGYETQYCHLKQNSVVVKPGDKVEKGQNIGQVGMSGLTSFPYLEFTVTLNGTAIDPFTGEDPVTGKPDIACDSLDIYPLWDKPAEKTLTYVQTALLSSGFSDKVPNAQGAQSGKYVGKKIANNSRLLSYWVDILGIYKGDDIKISITGPDGEILHDSTKTFNADKRHLFQFVGVKLDDKRTSWKNGEYVGKIELMSDTNGKTKPVIDARTLVQVVDPEDLLDEQKSKTNSKNPEENNRW